MKFLSVLLIALSLTACSSLLPKGPEPATLYTLNANTASAVTDTVSLPISLRILMPQAAPGLESEKIALRRKDNQLDYYSEARWTGSLSSLIQGQLVQSFDASKKLASVSNDLIAVNQDYSLLIEIHDFEIDDKTNSPIAHIRLTAKLIEGASNKITTTHDYEENESVKQNTMQSVISALNSAYQRISISVVSETLQTLQTRTPVKKRKAS